MPRKARVEYEGAIYHVMDRGDRLEKIYRGDRDRKIFYLEDYQWSVSSRYSTGR